MLVKTEVNGKDATEADIGGFCNFWDDRVSMCPRVRVRKTDMGTSQEQLEDLSGTYRLDVSTRPRQLVIKGSWSNGERRFGGSLHLPYELDGDTLRLRFFPADTGPAARPGAGVQPRVLTFRRDRRWEQPGRKVGAKDPWPELAAPLPKAKVAVKVEAVKPLPGWREKAILPAAPNPSWKPGVLLYTSFRLAPAGDLLGHTNGVMDLETGANLTYRPGWGSELGLHFLGFTPAGRPLALRVHMDPATQAAAGCTLIDCTTNRERAPLDAPWGVKAALRPDGRMLALSRGGAVTLWDATTGRQIGALEGRLEVDIKWLAFSPNGKMLLAAGTEPRWYTARTTHTYLKLWEVATRQERASRKEALELVEPSFDNGWGMVTPFSPDGKRIALPCQRFRWGSLRFWDTTALKDLGSIKLGEQEALRNFAFTPDGSGVALVAVPAAFDPGRPFTPPPLRIVHLAGGREQARIAPPGCGFAAVAYSPDGRLMVTQDNQGTIRIWERAGRR
jgi:hypothetical protein